MKKYLILILLLIFNFKISLAFIYQNEDYYQNEAAKIYKKLDYKLSKYQYDDKLLKIENIIAKIDNVIDTSKNKENILILSNLNILLINQLSTLKNIKNDFTKNEENNLCLENLGNITKQYKKETIYVESFDELYEGVLKANSKNDKTWLEIIIKSGKYKITKNLWVTGNKVIFRGESGIASDVVLHGDGMKNGINHGFMVAGKDIMIGDLTIKDVKNHAIQIHGEKDADNVFIHNLNIFNSGEQMIKGSFDKNISSGADNGVIQCSNFEYTAGVGPQYYIGGIDVHNGKNWKILNNTFKNIKSPDSKIAEHAIHFWSNSENTLVENNLIINSDRGIGFGLGDSKHIGGMIRNNIIYHDSSAGDVGIGLENASGVKVFHNTIFFENNYSNAIEYRFAGTDATIYYNLTNKAIAKRDSGIAKLQSNVTDAKKEYFKDISKYDFSLTSNIKNVVVGAIKKDLINSNKILKTQTITNQVNNSSNTGVIKSYLSKEDIKYTFNTFEKNAEFLREVYVDKNINVDGIGTKDKPYKTFTKAFENVKPGDVIILKSGIYEGGNYITNFKGTQKNPIKVIGEGEVIISGGNTGIQIVDGVYVILRNITIELSKDNGINFDDGGDYNTPANNIIIDNLTVKNIGNGQNQDMLKMSGVNDFYVINSKFINGSAGGSGIDMVGCHNGIIENNYFYNLGSNFIQAKGGSKDIMIKNNFGKKVIGRAINMGGSTGSEYFRPSISSGIDYEAKNISVIKNVFVNAECGVAFVGCIDCKATHNIIYKPNSWAFRILQETTSLGGKNFLPASNGEFSKNIVVFDSNLKSFVNIGPSTNSESFKFDKNLWFSTISNFNYYGDIVKLPKIDQNVIYGINPLFIDENDDKFGLKEGSPMYQTFNEIN